MTGFLSKWADGWSRTLGADAPTLDLRGLELSQDQFDVLMASAPHVQGHPALHGLRLDEAKIVTALHVRALFGSGTTMLSTEFMSTLRFGGSHFGDGTTFYGCTFNGPVDFGDIKTSGNFTMSNCDFRNGLLMASARFRGTALLNDLRIAGSVNLNACEADGYLDLEDLAVELGDSDSVTIERSIFREGLSLQGISATSSVGKSEDHAWLSVAGSRAYGDVTMRNAEVSGGVSLDHMSILSTVDLRSMRVDGDLTLDGAHVQGDILLSDTEVAGGDLVLRGAIFQRPVSMRLRASNIDLRDAQFADGGFLSADAESFVVTGATFRPTLRLEGMGQARPVIPDLKNCDVSGLALRAIDLSNCDFSGAVGLESVRIDQSSKFDKEKVAGLPSRLLISQELAWRRRAERTGSRRIERTVAVRPELRSMAADAARTYAGLRESVESRGDISGSAGYYLGEMEMRRWSAVRAERTVLVLYRWLSGYGMSPGRAAAFFGLWVISFGTMIGLFGLKAADEIDPISRMERVYEGLIYSMSNAIVLFGGISRELSRTGEVLAVGLGLGSPILLGLTILSLRNQIRR